MSELDRKIRAAVIQMNSGADPDRNIECALTLMESAITEQSANLIVLPENFLCYGSSGLSALVSSLDTYLETLSSFAQKHSVTLVAGSIPYCASSVLTDVAPHQNMFRVDMPAGAISNTGKFFSRSLVIDAKGQVVGAYDKCHLFDVDVEDGFSNYRESETYAAGSASVVATVEGLGLGLSICYDLRFPDLYQHLVDLGAKLITVPSAFTAVTGKAHWEVLLRARAIETQCYVIAANQWGDHGKGRETWGHSMIVDPWGEIVAECTTGISYCVAEIELDKLARVRKAIPVQQHKRF